MSREKSLIETSDAPQTRAGIRKELELMGLATGDLVLMHTSQSKLGWVCGGEQSVVAAVLDTIGETGTLVTPGFSSQLSDPGDWSSPPVPEDWLPVIRDNMPLFDRHETQTRGMGRVVEVFRKWPGTQRSDHPVDSFLANGPLADELLADHPISYSLGPKSPLGKLMANNAKILLLGAEYQSCTCFHLAEAGLPGSGAMQERYPFQVNGGKTEWQSATQPQSFEGEFAKIGQVLDDIPGVVTTGFSGTARLFEMGIAVQTARAWLSDNLSDIME